MPYQSFVENTSANVGQENNNSIPAGNTTINAAGAQGFHSTALSNDEELSLSGGAGNLGRIPANREPGSESSI